MMNIREKAGLVLFILGISAMVAHTENGVVIGGGMIIGYMIIMFVGLILFMWQSEKGK
jgi:hypothetical protein